MWWFWPKLLSKSYKIVSSNFCPSLSSSCFRYNLLPPHTAFWPALHVLLFLLNCTSQISGDPAMRLWLRHITVLWVLKILDFLYEIFILRPYFEHPVCILCFLAGFIVRAVRFTTVFLLLFFFHSHWWKIRDRLLLFTWRSCGEVTVTVQNFSFIVIRLQNMYLHITDTKYYHLSWYFFTKPWFLTEAVMTGNRYGV